MPLMPTDKGVLGKHQMMKLESRIQEGMGKRQGEFRKLILESELEPELVDGQRKSSCSAREGR